VGFGHGLARQDKTAETRHGGRGEEPNKGGRQDSMVHSHAVDGPSEVIQSLLVAGDANAGTDHERSEDLDKARVKCMGCKLQNTAIARDEQSGRMGTSAGAEGTVFNDGTLFSLSDPIYQFLRHEMMSEGTAYLGLASRARGEDDICRVGRCDRGFLHR